MQRTTPLALAVAALLGAAAASTVRAARADTRAAAPAGGGLPALEVKVDLSPPAIEAGGARLPIPLRPEQVPAAGDVTVEVVGIGHGRSVVHVRVPVKGDVAGVAWEAILAGGRSQPIFAGMTGLVSGDPGERTGKRVEVVGSGDERFVLVGDVREDLSLCREAEAEAEAAAQPEAAAAKRPLLDPLALYPTSLDLRPATVQRLDDEEIASAEPATATPEAPGSAPPLARLLVARGTSVPGSTGAELTDGDASTFWTERRPGAGRGEFVVMAAPKDVPIARLRVILGPPARPGAGGLPASAANMAAPSRFYLVTADRVVAVSVARDAWSQPGAYDVVLPQPLRASCLALVLDAAYGRGLPHPDVAVAELQAYSEFDAAGATLDDVAAKLAGDRGPAAAQVLERAGEGALAAVERVWDRLDAKGRALAIDVAASHARCEEAATLLARGLCDRGGGEAARRAREKLDRCPEAAPALARGVREDASSRTCLAPVLAAIAPREAEGPIADALAAATPDDVETRATLRSALADALRSAPAERLRALLEGGRRSAFASLEVLRAARGRLAEVAPQALALLAESTAGAPSMRARYLAVGPLEELARAGDRDAVARLAAILTRDPDARVRAHAADAGAGIAGLEGALLSAAHDPEPRVREAALQSLAVASPPAPAVPLAEEALSREGWSFVRVQAAGVLAQAAAGAGVDDALGGALHDASVRVRGAAVVALGHHRAAAWRKQVRERLDDPDEDGDVRAAAARALGAMCDAGSLDRLTELARALGAAGAGEDEQAVALGAVAALADLQPRDLRSRLAPLVAPTSPPYVRAAAAQALSARGACPSEVR